MSKKFILVMWTAVLMVFFSQVIQAQNSTEINLSDKKQRLYSHAFEGAVWGMPIAAFDAMRQAFFRDAGAQYGDIVYYSQFADWKLQLTTPNASTYYVWTNYNTSSGPVVLEMPAAVGGGIFGSVCSAWQVPLDDVGPIGADKGKGGRYLLLPPGYKESIPSGYFPIPSDTYNGYAAFRVIPASSSEEDRLKGMELVKKMRTYPLSKAENPPQGKHIDMAGRLFDGIVKYDQTFYISLAKMINEEPVLRQDLAALSQLRTIGIEKGKEFTPDAQTNTILNKAIQDVQQWCMEQIPRHIQPYWEGTHLGLPMKTGTATAFTFITKDGFYDIDERAMTFFAACALPKHLGGASFYANNYVDKNNEILTGDHIYRLRVPANVPAKQYWSATVYDASSSGFIKQSPVISLDSYNKKMKRNADGSVDIYFAPKAPEGQENNWVYTAPGKQWFYSFRIYGPDKALADKSWKLGDLEKINQL